MQYQFVFLCLVVSCGESIPTQGKAERMSGAHSSSLFPPRSRAYRKYAESFNSDSNVIPYESHGKPPLHELYPQSPTVMVNINRGSGENIISFLLPETPPGKPVIVNGGRSTNRKRYNLLYIKPSAPLTSRSSDVDDMGSLPKKNYIYPLQEAPPIPVGNEFSSFSEPMQPEVFLIKYKGDGNGALLGQNGVSNYNRGEISFELVDKSHEDSDQIALDRYMYPSEEFGAQVLPVYGSKSRDMNNA